MRIYGLSFHVIRIALLLNEVSEKKDTKFEMKFPIVSPKFPLKIRPQFFSAFLAGRKSLPTKFGKIHLFPIRDTKYQVK